MAIVITVPWPIWRLGRTDYWAPLVVQIITSETFTALLPMAVASTMLTEPTVEPKLRGVRDENPATVRPSLR
ncbi:hypothetical protein [Hydrogenophaga sp.]|uniref:hypothetical protein n=1 Tax=Hydrogenophaga sp. TaxID=1904254 RepID=UPI002FC9C02A